MRGGWARSSFHHRTPPGRPVSGEEAFILHLGDDVWLTMRSLTRPSPRLLWRVLYPLLHAAQIFARRRYLRALSSQFRLATTASDRAR